jgi:protein-tyrosine phosphatase
VQADERRLLRLVGTRNLRDLGGYPTADGRQTRWRTLYRSDCLDTLAADGQVWLVDAGLSRIIDLRDDFEVASRPNVFATSTSAGVSYRRVPLWDNLPPPDTSEAPRLNDGYTRVLEECGPRLVAVVQALLESDGLPALVHCAAGKDRTGVVCALVLAGVGVEEATIVQDYALSIACLGPEYVAENRRLIEGRGLSWTVWAAQFDTPPERMLKTLGYLEARFGGAKRYLLQHGLPEAAIAELRDRLTEPESA